jgi:ABC-type dipeptide/oligopeptide/nickel transport system permease subunit
MARTYAYSHAVKSALLRKPVGWISTNAKHTAVSHAFQQTTRFIKVYCALYLFLILLGLRTGDIHLLDLDYWSVQFWMFWNFLLTSLLLVSLVKTKRVMSGQPSLLARMNPLYAPAWQVAVFSFMVGFLIGIPAFMQVMPRAGMPAVHGTTVTAHVVPTSNPTRAPQPTTKLSPTPTRSSQPTPTPGTKSHTPPVEKEYGGWYWQPALERAQRWLGTDSQGQDIWTDSNE